MAFHSSYNYARISPRKARLVVDLIRGRRVDEALTALQMSKRRGSEFVRKVLDAAIAAADEAEADVRNLRVVEARVDEGPTMKRFQPKDRGRAFPIHKKMSHIRVAVDEA